MNKQVRLTDHLDPLAPAKFTEPWGLGEEWQPVSPLEAAVSEDRVRKAFAELLASLHDVEVRETDQATGGQKGKKLTQVGALDPVALIELARVAGMGANKYAAFNYLKGYDWSLSFNAMMRHALLFWAGEDRDGESHQIHMAHAAWMALSLVSFSMRKLGNDDRPPR